MKTLLLSLSLLLLATACDSPQRNRLASSVNTGNGLGQPTGNNTGGGNVWSTPGGTTGSTTGSGTTDTRPPGFENCDISPKYYAAGINYIGVCQSTLDETSIAVKTTVADTAKTCLIPTYKDGSGSSTYLGQPQCFEPKEDVVTMGQLYKTRSGFTNSPINGVMVIKEASIGAYFTCMNAYINFPRSAQCPNGAYSNAYCSQMASANMQAICNSFKVDHSYIDIRLK